MKQAITRIVSLGAVLYVSAMMGRAEPAKVDDPSGILRKPIPDKLVLLTGDTAGSGEFAGAEFQR